MYIYFFEGCPQHMEFLGQGSELSCSCNLCHGCSNAGSLTLCARVRIKFVSQHSRDTADPVAPQQELQHIYFYNIYIYIYTYFYRCLEVL